MSLMDEMTNVVTVGRELFSTVSGKMKEIDGKVNEATASVPNTLRGMLEIQTWVDGITGDDNNSGDQSSAPKKTLTAALARGVSGCSHTILLNGGQTYVMDQLVSTSGQEVKILNSSESKTMEDRAVVSFGVDANDQPNYLSPSLGSITFSGVVIRHPSADGRVPASDEPLNNALFRGVGSIIQLDYRYSLPTTVEFGENPNAILLTSDRALSTLVLASSEATGAAGKMASNRYGGATMIRIGAHSSDAGIDLYPESATSVNFDYLIP